MYDMIMKKRNGAEHTADEIRFIVEGFTKGEIPDYQMSAWLMCVYYKGMTHDETCALTHAMAESGGRTQCTNRIHRFLLTISSMAQAI
jgi:pyrimidine-nucleoside phosphorylase